ncbi:hypothetical protein BJX68DRAFT_142831 [Aspergillus pseudodeflectus]|uniref:Amidase domain-containing protein n=1 Tax=Aspergillus pseudodeflectus TaxID=176178 RepID=A0ABR4L5S0_9EURO
MRREWASGLSLPTLAGTPLQKEAQAYPDWIFRRLLSGCWSTFGRKYDETDKSAFSWRNNCGLAASTMILTVPGWTGGVPAVFGGEEPGSSQMGVRFHYLASIPVILRSGPLNEQWPEPDA